MKSFCRFGPSGRHLYLLHNTNTPLDAESHEEQDGRKHKFVGGMMATLWPNVNKGVGCNKKHRREMKMNPAEEGDSLQASMIGVIITGI